MHAQSFTRVQLFAIPRTVAHQVPLSMGLARQEYRSRLSFPPPVDLPNPRIEPKSPASSALADGFFTTVSPGTSLSVDKQTEVQRANTPR